MIFLLLLLLLEEGIRRVKAETDLHRLRPLGVSWIFQLGRHDDLSYNLENNNNSNDMKTMQKSSMIMRGARDDDSLVAVLEIRRQWTLEAE